MPTESMPQTISTQWNSVTRLYSKMAARGVKCPCSFDVTASPQPVVFPLSWKTVFFVLSQCFFYRGCDIVWNDAMFSDILKEGVAFIFKELEVLAGIHFSETSGAPLVWSHIFWFDIATSNYSNPTKNFALWTLQNVQRAGLKLATVKG
jgi:hypothetical protein